jgi:hypothetical protein
MIDLAISAVPAVPAASTVVPGGTSTAALNSQRRVFTGEWLANGCGCHLYRDGYVGELVRRWNGWAVFRASRPVAAAIVAAQQRVFMGLMLQEVGDGARTDDAWLRTAAQVASVTWAADMIVVDSRALHDDPQAVEISTPDGDAFYTVGWGWMWDDTDAANVHTIHGGGI